MTSRNLALLTALLASATLVSVLQPRQKRLRKKYDAPGLGPPDQGRRTKVPAKARREIKVTLEKTDTGWSIAVDPWLVAIEKDPVWWQPRVHWHLEAKKFPGPVQWYLSAKPGKPWPFEKDAPTPVKNGNGKIPVGKVEGNVGEFYSYNIHLKIGSETIVIDPEIFIC